MKLVKKWLFPILTCLIVMGAAVLPPYISQVKDVRQFEQIHSTEQNADALPVREVRDQLERLELYARWYTNSEIIPSFQTPTIDKELAEQALDRLAQAGVISTSVTEDSMEHIEMERILLWDPSDSTGFQQPVEFWSISADLGDGALCMNVDGESGLPLMLSLYDPNMARWLQFKDPGTLSDLAGRYFELLGLEAHFVESDVTTDAAPWERQFVIDGTGSYYGFSINATMMNIGPDQRGTVVIN